MLCEIGEHYKLQVVINERLITYTATILGRDATHLVFKDRDGKTIQVKEADIVFSEKLKELMKL